MMRRSLAACLSAALMASVPALAASNLIVNGTFKSGNTDFTTGYTLTTMTPYLFQNGVHGIYTVEPAGSIAGSSAYNDWTNVSADPKGGNGNVFVADAATTAGNTAWSQTVTVTPHTKYKFTYYAAEVSNPCCSNATLAASVNGVTGKTLTAGAAWQKSSYVWDSGTATSAMLAVTDTNTSGPYNDFALDYFSFKQVGK